MTENENGTEVQAPEGWGTVETNFITDYIFVIDEAYFAPNAQYKSGEVLLMQWHGMGYDENGDPIVFDRNKEPGERSEFYPVGSGWESQDGGKTAVHVKGQESFNASSLYGTIINRAIKDMGLSSVLAQRGTAKDAKVWEGLVFHMVQEEKDWGGEIGKKSRVMPVQYLGTKEEWLKSVGASGATAAPAAAPASAPVQETLTEAPAAGDSPTVLRAKMKAAAKGVDYATFTAKALEIPGVDSNESLLAEIFDESGIYAEANGASV